MTRYTPLLLAFLALTSCQTLDGIGNDLSSAWNASTDALTRVTATDVTAQKETGKTSGTPSSGQTTHCPPVTVMEELKTIFEFQDLSKPSTDTEMAHATMRNVTARCAQGDDLSVELDIMIETSLGPKARVKKTDKPTFAFPYFVAVISPQGHVLAKEIFAASFSFEKGENNLTHTETITQHIPLGGKDGAPAYSILIGFQLGEEQLAFNRTQPILKGSPADAP